MSLIHHLYATFSTAKTESDIEEINTKSMIQIKRVIILNVDCFGTFRRQKNLKNDRARTGQIDQVTSWLHQWSNLFDRTYQSRIKKMTQKIIQFRQSVTDISKWRVKNASTRSVLRFAPLQSVDFAFFAMKTNKKMFYDISQIRSIIYLNDSLLLKRTGKCHRIRDASPLMDECLEFFTNLARFQYVLLSRLIDC